MNNSQKINENQTNQVQEYVRLSVINPYILPLENYKEFEDQEIKQLNKRILINCFKDKYFQTIKHDSNDANKQNRVINVKDNYLKLYKKKSGGIEIADNEHIDEKQLKDKESILLDDVLNVEFPVIQNDVSQSSDKNKDSNKKKNKKDNKTKLIFRTIKLHLKASSILIGEIQNNPQNNRNFQKPEQNQIQKNDILVWTLDIHVPKTMKFDSSYHENNEENLQRKKLSDINNGEQIEQNQQIIDYKKKQIKQAWEFRYHIFWEEFNNEKDSIENQIKSGIRLFTFIGQFRQECLENAVELVKDLSLPEKFRRYQQIEPSHPFYNFKEKKELAYQINNIIFRITYISINKEKDEKQTKNIKFNDEGGHLYSMYNDYYFKMAQNEFLSFDFLTEALQLLSSQNNDFKFRVPLTCSIDYYGFKITCMAKPLIENGQQSLLHGPTPSGDYKVYQPILDHLNLLSSSLNLQSFPLELKNKNKVDVHLSLFSEIHASKEESWEEVRKIIELDDIGEEFLSEEQLKSQIKKSNKKKMQKDKKEQKEPEFYYLIKTGHIFPLEVDIQHKGEQQLFSKRLRPEFMADHCEQPLSNGCFLFNIQTQEQQQNEINLAEAGLKLQNKIIKNLTQSLDKLDHIPVDSISIAKVFHKFGVNMRHLGQVASKTSMPHIRDICVIEMVARSAKKIFRANLSDFILNEFKNKNEALFHKLKLRQQMFESRQKLQNQDVEFNLFIAQNNEDLALQLGETQQMQMQGLRDLQKDDIYQQLDLQIKQFIQEFLNFLFGNDQDSDQFWVVIQNQIQIDFQYNFPPKNRKSLILGGLLHAIQYHFRLQFSEQINLELLFNSVTPFKAHTIISGLVPSSKVYTFRSLQLNQIAEKFLQHKQNKNWNLAQQSLKVKLLIEKQLKVSNFIVPAASAESLIMAEIAEVLLELEKIDESQQYAKLSLDQIPHYHAQSIKPLQVMLKIYLLKIKQSLTIKHDGLTYFDQTVKNLEYHWGKFHPFIAGVMCIMSQIYITRNELEQGFQYLSKTLETCKIALGPNHLQTAQIYQEIAQILFQSKKRKQSLHYYEEALNIYLAEKGQENISVANIMYKIGTVYQMLGLPYEQLTYMEKSIQIFLLQESNLKEIILMCAFECLNASINLNFYDKIIDYSEIIWKMIEKYQINDQEKILFIIQESLRANFTFLLPEKKTYLIQILIYYKTASQNNNANKISENINSSPQSYVDNLQKPYDIQIDDIKQFAQQNNLLNSQSNQTQQQEYKSLKSIIKDQNYKSPIVSKNKNKQIRFAIDQQQNEELYQWKGPIKEDSQDEILEYIKSSIRDSKSIIEFIKNLLIQLFGKFDELYYQQMFYTKFKNMLASSTDEVFLDALETYKTIILLYGEKYIYSTLKQESKEILIDSKYRQLFKAYE